ncbi:ATP-binding protein [Ramlibacter sp. AN1133]|uniref:ATP-binding protein n=1 Tax=Ramlibacter sp. AN1133 TaxID=3133429 RepID=UPI0030BCB973
MSLSLRINLIVAGVITVLVASTLALQLDNLRSAVREEIVATNRVSTQLLQRVARVYAENGPHALVRFLERLGRVRANDITVTDASGQVLYRSPPSTYKLGREAPAWFKALVLPAPSHQVIELPWGRMTIDAEPSRAVLDGWDEVVTLAAIGAAGLLVINALVFWAMGRALRPFGQIVSALDRLKAGDFNVTLPPLAGREAAAIGAAFNRMAAVLQENMANRQRAFEAERRLSDSRELAGLIETHIETERHEIARSLHDELGQSVTAIRSLALSVAHRCGTSDPQAAQAAGVIADEAGRLYDAMHRMIPRLAPMELETLGLAEAIGELLERSRAAHPAVAIEQDLRELPAGLSPAATLAAYRIVQEGLTNALQHASARRVRVQVAREDDALVLRVLDDGVGPPEDWSRPGHFGLRWLGERADALGGELDLAARPEGGTELRARLPIVPAEAQAA